MLTINPTLYERLAELLVESIDGHRYYSEVIKFEDHKADYIFSATLMVNYQTLYAEDGHMSNISNMIPIWWEFHSICEDGEVLNDFDFNILKQIICR